MAGRMDLGTVVVCGRSLQDHRFVDSCPNNPEEILLAAATTLTMIESAIDQIDPGKSLKCGNDLHAISVLRNMTQCPTPT